MSKRPLSRRWHPELQKKVQNYLKWTLRRKNGAPLAIPDAQTMPDISSIPISGAKRMSAAILFFDLENFTTITAVLPMERTLRLLNLIIPSVMRIVRHWGGFLEKNTGDGVMAILGTETKDLNLIAQDGIECAMAIRYLIQNDVQPTIGRAELPPINFRVGLDMGEVLIGKIGLFNHNFLTAVGTVANLASKLQELARPNGICIGDGLARNLHTYLLQFCELGDDPSWNWQYGRSGPPYNYYHFKFDWPDPGDWIRGGFFRQPIA